MTTLQQPLIWCDRQGVRRMIYSWLSSYGADGRICARSYVQRIDGTAGRVSAKDVDESRARCSNLQRSARQSVPTFRDLLTAEVDEKQMRSIKYQLIIAKLPLAKDLDDPGGETQRSGSLTVCKPCYGTLAELHALRAARLGRKFPRRAWLLPGLTFCTERCAGWKAAQLDCGRLR